MDELTQRQWNDVAPRIITRPCPFCHEQYLSSEPRYGVVGGVDVLSVVCDECGHTIFFDVDVLHRMAKRIDDGFHNDGLRKD